MEKYLITGISGFVARHFLLCLQDKSEACEVLGLDIQVSPDLAKSFTFPLRCQSINLLDWDAVEAGIVEFQPTKVLHLASVSNVGVSWKNPRESFVNNTNIFLNLLEALRIAKIPARVLSVGSSEEYGVIRAEDLPLRETKPLHPGSPYGVARVAQEMLSEVYAEGFGMDIVMTRSFNHIGPGQREQFVIPSFVRQVVLAKRNGSGHCTIHAGNTKVVRDFLDVRDVVEAYHRLLENGTAGQVYNICSGIGRSLDEVLVELQAITGIRIELQPDPSLFRPNELMTIIGSPEKVHAAVGWQPRRSFRQSLVDLVEYWDKKLAGEQEELSHV